MAEKTEFLQAIDDAILDADSLERFINGDDTQTVLTRLNAQYPTLQKALKEMFENGGIAGRFKTLAELQASSLADGDYALVADDTNDKNGIYIKEGGAWVKSKYDVSKLVSDNYKDRVKAYKTDAELLSSTAGVGQIAVAIDSGNIYSYELFDKPVQQETTNVLSRIGTQLSDKKQKTINRLIYDLKESGVWDKLDGFWVAVTSNLEDSFVNWKSQEFNLTLNGDTGILNQSHRGYWWISSWYNLNTGLSTGGANVKASQDSLSFGLTLSSTRVQANVMGAYDGSKGSSISYRPSNDSASIEFRVNQGASRTAVEAPLSGSSRTKLTITRSGDKTRVISNDFVTNENNVTSLAPSDAPFYIGGIDGTQFMVKEGWGAGVVYSAYVASALTVAETLALHDALDLFYSLYVDGEAAPEIEWVQLSSGVGGSGSGDVASDKLDAIYKQVFGGEKGGAGIVKLEGNVSRSIINQEYLGGYIEIQPDSWTGSRTATDATTETWGFPYSLTKTEQARLKKDLFKGDGKGLHYVRFPLGFAYRGYRNIDPESGLARNIGERYQGQDASLKRLFEDISDAGGGLAPEYWCPPVHWVTSGSYHGTNTIRAGGTYDRTVSLDSIRNTDPQQYDRQIDEFTDAIVDDFEYLHTNIAPVRMYGLANEPRFGRMAYGACSYSPEVYSDILLKLHPKIMASEVLGEWNGEQNTPLLHVASEESTPYWHRAAKLLNEHPEYVWGYTFHAIQQLSGQKTSGSDYGADYYRSTEFLSDIEGVENPFTNEFEYFYPQNTSNEWKCANSMLAYVNSVIYCQSKVIMPIIHICKEIGATSTATNTEGYALTKVNLQEGYGLAPNEPNNKDNLYYGTYSPVKHNYNAWKFISDNLPIGAVRVGGTPESRVDGVNYCAYLFEGRLHVFIVNRTVAPVSVQLNFDDNITLEGKLYNVNDCGSRLEPVKGESIGFVIPAHSGQFWLQV